MTGQGEFIADRYRLLARIGRGAMGVVWRARDERLDRIVAVKELLADPDDPGALAGDREGRVAARLRHPHAITTHDAVEHNGRRYLVMEYFPSRSLAAVVADGGPLPADAVARIGRQVADALAGAHGEGIVHRDVKPANVLLNADGIAKIADFGISRALGDGTLTGGTMVVGTPAYLAPEVAAGDHAGFSSDVFSFGATLYTALEGAPPFGFDENPIAMLHRVARAAIVPPAQHGPLVDVVLWMLCRNPGERPTMREVQQALDAVVLGRPSGAPPPEPAEPSGPAAPADKRRRRLVGAGLVALVLIAVGVLIGTLLPARMLTIVTASPRSPDRPPASTGSTPPSSLPSTLVPTTTATTATITHSTQDTPVPLRSAEPGCTAHYRVTSSWPGGYQAEVTVVNETGAVTAGWTVRWTLPAGTAITNLWSGTFTVQGSAITVSNLDWNAKLAAGGTATFGLTATAPGEAGIPVLTCQSR